MATIYIDSNKHCHTTNPNGDYREFDVPYFDGKCQEYIEGCIYCPEGESYVRDDGEVFHGECHTFWQPSGMLDAAQREYERKKLADAENALAILLGGVV